MRHHPRHPANEGEALEVGQRGMADHPVDDRRLERHARVHQLGRAHGQCAHAGQQFSQRFLHPHEKALLDSVLSCAAIGAPESVRQGLQAFIERTGARCTVRGSRLKKP